MTFDQVLGPYATPDERDELAWHLAQFRARNTYEALRWKGKSRTAATKDAIARLDRDFPGAFHKQKNRP